MVKIRKPKKRGLIPRKSKSLTAQDDYVLKQVALRYLVDETMPIKEVAKKLNTTVSRVKGFFEDPEFTEDLNKRVEKIHGIDGEFRINQAKISISHIYEEIRRREAEEELKNVPLKDLHKILIDFQKELRLDTPGDYTSKVGVGDLSKLQDRYKESLSGKIHRKGRKKIPLGKGNGSLENGSGDKED